MPATAKLELKRTKLIMQQSTDCVVSLVNTGRTILHDVNPKTVQAYPLLEVTDLATKTVQQFSLWRPGGEEYYEYDLQPGDTKTLEFFLSDVVTFPKPGKYEIRARFEWNKGSESAVSEPTTVEVSPATPVTLNTATAYGHAGGMCFAVWLHKPDPTDRGLAIWLSRITTTEKPKVTHAIHLEDVRRPVSPVISVPPATAPIGQWVAWIDDETLQCVLSQSEQLVGPESIKLQESGWKIIPPVFQTIPGRGEALPGADVLMSREVEGQASHHLRLARLRAGGKTKLEDPQSIGDIRIAWAQSVYFPSLSRVTFLIGSTQQLAALHMSEWSETKAPRPLKKLLDLPGRFVAANVTLAEKDVRGTVLMEFGERAAKTYSLVNWKYTPNSGFEEGEPTQIKTPEGFSVSHAIAAVNRDGVSFAMIKGDNKHPIWYFVDGEGVALPLAGTGEKFKLPADILFRRGIEPVVLFAEPEQGFILAKPR